MGITAHWVYGHTPESIAEVWSVASMANAILAAKMRQHPEVIRYTKQ